MTSEEPTEYAAPVELLCVECGEMVKVNDVVALIRALHLLNECTTRSLLAPQS